MIGWRIRWRIRWGIRWEIRWGIGWEIRWGIGWGMTNIDKHRRLARMGTEPRPHWDPLPRAPPPATSPAPRCQVPPPATSPAPRCHVPPPHVATSPPAPCAPLTSPRVSSPSTQHTHTHTHTHLIYPPSHASHNASQPDMNARPNTIIQVSSGEQHPRHREC